MNPYLEQYEVWHDFHERFMPAVSEVLVPLVRPGYIVRLDEHLYIHELSADERRFGGRGGITVARAGPSVGVSVGQTMAACRWLSMSKASRSSRFAIAAIANW